MISAANTGAVALDDLFRRCGLSVWTPQSAGDARMYSSAICLVIDMPGDAAYQTLQLFRDYGVDTPALLIVDPGKEVALSELNCGNVMDVVPRDTNPLRIMRWVQSLLVARTALDQSQRLSA